MTNLKTRGSFLNFYSWLPIILLFVSVLNEFDFNYLNLKYFSFNFPFILIFFFTLSLEELIINSFQIIFKDIQKNYIK